MLKVASETNPILCFDKYKKQAVHKIPDDSEAAIRYHTVDAILGVIYLLAGPYLVVVSGSKILGRYFNHDIKSVTSVAIVQLSCKQLSAVENQQESQYLSMLQTLLSSGYYYYSHTLNITHSIQRIAGLSDNKDEVDERFYWNKHMQDYFRELLSTKEFAYENLAPWNRPVMYGFVQFDEISLPQKNSVQHIIISRRSRHRAGTRYNKRGSNRKGHVANYVESEQILVKNDRVVSNVQVRGSIPLLWEQKINLTLEPRVLWRTKEANEHADVFQKHFEDQIKTYGKQIVISLIRTTGNHEGPMAKMFQEQITKLNNNNIQYLSFDLNKELGYFSAMNKIDLLWNKISDTMDKFGIFSGQTTDGIHFEHVKNQQGVARTNCRDNLDRTNFVQTHLFVQAFVTQLAALGINFNEFPTVDKIRLTSLIRVICADNGDAVSTQYAGTGSIRTGHVRGLGPFQAFKRDISNSLLRYYFSNFYDGFRQDAIDLVRKSRIINRVKENQPVLAEKKGFFGWIAFMLVTLFMLAKPKNVNSFFGFWMAVIWSVLLAVTWKILRLDPNLVTIRPSLQKKK